MACVALKLQQNTPIGSLILLVAEHLVKKSTVTISMELIDTTYGLVEVNDVGTFLSVDREIGSMAIEKNGVTTCNFVMKKLPEPQRKSTVRETSRSVSGRGAPPPPPKTPTAPQPPPPDTTALRNMATKLQAEMRDATTSQGQRLLGTHKLRGRDYPACFVACEAVEWVMTTNEGALSYSAVVELWSSLFSLGAIAHVEKEDRFKDGDKFFYVWTESSRWSTEGLQQAVEPAPSPRPAAPPGSASPNKSRAEWLELAYVVHASMSAAKNAKGKYVIGDHRAYMYQFRNSFVGEEAVGWAISSELKSDPRLKLATRAEAVHLFDSFLALGAIQHVNHSQNFRDAAFLYRWQDLSKLTSREDSEPLARESSISLADIAAKLLRLHTTIDGRTKSTLAEWEQNTLPLIKAKIQVLHEKLNILQRNAAKHHDGPKTPQEEAEEASWEADLVLIKGQLDEQKQQLHFPEPEGWLVRLGTDGVYVGIKGIALDTLEASFTLRVGKELIVSGDANHPCMIHIKVPQVTVRVAIDTLGVVGEKGSSVPNFTKARLALCADIALDTRLQVNRSKKWKARAFDCKVSIQQSEGLGLPAPLVKWVSSIFLPTAIRTGLLGALPSQLATYLGAQANEALEISGLMHVYGIPIGVLDQSLRLGKAQSAKNIDTSDLTDSRRAAYGVIGSAGVGLGQGTNNAAKHAHLLAKLRRRLNLLGLKKLPLFASCSKWSTIANFKTYVVALDRFATAEEREQVRELWQRALSSFAAEDGLKALSISALFEQMRRVNRSPHDILFELTKVNANMELSGILTMVYDMTMAALKDKLSKKKVPEEAQKAKAKIEKLRATGQTIVEMVTDALSRVKTSLKGELLGGRHGGSFEVGMEELLVSALPHVKLPLSVLNVAPSDLALAMYAQEGKDGQFIIDVGVPQIQEEEQPEDLKDELEDPSCMLRITRASLSVQKNQPQSSEVEEENKEDGLEKWFPTSSRIVVARLQEASLEFRLDTSNLADPCIFKGQFKKAEKGYVVDITGAKGFVMDVTMKGLKAAGAPGLIGKWLEKELRAQRLKQGISEPPAGETKEEDLSASELAVRTLMKDIRSAHLLLSFNLMLDLKCSKQGIVLGVGPVDTAISALRFTNNFFAGDIISDVKAISAAVAKEI